MQGNPSAWVEQLIDTLDILWNGLVSFAEKPLFPAITALLGAVTGASVNQVTIDRREKRKAQKESEAIRMILKLEIDHNLREIEKVIAGIENWLQAEGLEKSMDYLLTIGMQRSGFNKLIQPFSG